jgi:surfeit locus 1 family protein
LPGLAALLCGLLTTALGFWQLDRATQKQARQATCDAAMALPAQDLSALPDSTPMRRVRVSGRFAGAFQIYLDNRMYQGRAGYHLVVPLVYPGGVVLVDRGWLPAVNDRAILPAAVPPAGPVTLEGLLVPAQSRYLELSGRSSPGPVWENLDLARLRAWYRSDLSNRLLLQTSDGGDGLVRDWPRPDAGTARHLGYAAQWFALTALTIALYGYYGIWRPSHASP